MLARMEDRMERFATSTDSCDAGTPDLCARHTAQDDGAERLDRADDGDEPGDLYLAVCRHSGGHSRDRGQWRGHCWLADYPAVVPALNSTTSRVALGYGPSNYS